MMKYMTHYLAVFIFFLAFSLSGQDVEISIDHPVTVNAGEDFEVTVTIKKGSLSDYSRFSQDLPLGISATNVSSPNADFSFDEQRGCFEASMAPRNQIGYIAKPAPEFPLQVYPG